LEREGDQILKIDADGKLNLDSLPQGNEKKLKKTLISFFIDSFYKDENLRLKEFMESLERTILIKILTKFNGHQKKTAEFLGLKISTLNQKIKKHNIRFRKTPFEG